MKSVTADDGRILTPPTELKPLLKESFPAFSKLLGHVRFFYIANEIWDGHSSLIFNFNGEPLITIYLSDGCFQVCITDDNLFITQNTSLDRIYKKLKQVVPVRYHRPPEQLTINPDPDIFPCGYRCDLCLGSEDYKLSHNDNFAYMNWVCYHGCVTGVDIERPSADEAGIFRCSGCTQKNNKFCQCITCSKEKGYVNCVECGEYHSCDVYFGSHYTAQCNLGITAEEVTKLIIPYCMKERLDYYREQLKAGEKNE